MGDESLTLPILVSSDNHVLDGHHRWLANHYRGNKQPVIRLPFDAATSLAKMGEYDHTFKKEIHEDAAAAVSIGAGAMDNTVAPVKQKSFKLWRRRSTS